MNWLKRLLGSNGSDVAAEAPSAATSAISGLGSGNNRDNTRLTQLNGRDELAGKPALDLVDGLNALAEYYRYVEAETYDRALKTAREHRDFRSELLQRAEVILAYQQDSEACRLIQRAIEKERAAFSGVSTVTVDVIEEVRVCDPEGFSLLALAAPLTFDSLRTAYRKCALRHHPDVGGDNETMSKINDAYELFNAILRRRAAEDDVLQQEAQPAQSTVEMFFARIRYAKFSALIDDLDVEAAFNAYQALNVSEIELQFRPWNALSRLCEVLAASSRPDDAKRVLNDLGVLVEFGESRGLILEPTYRRTAESCVAPKKIRFIPNHIRQAENLLRFGIIDKRRYDAVVKRVGEATTKIAEDEGAFENFARSFEFRQLPIDPPVPNQQPPGLVPAPDYYARIETLNESQRGEYALAFHGGQIHLAKKYLAVRMDALLRAVFFGYADIGAIICELNALREAPGLKPGLAALCDEAVKVVSFLASLTARERNERITALRSLDANPFPAIVKVFDRSASGAITWSKPIMMNPTYTAFATGPMGRIDLYMRTGSELTGDEAMKERKKWEALRAFHESDIYKRAREAAWGERDPERIAKAVTPLCEAMYSRAASEPDNSLEIAYWTDKLTIALVKLKRFEDALHWILRYEEAPLFIRGRAANGVLEALNKRKARCEAALSR